MSREGPKLACNAKGGDLMTHDHMLRQFINKNYKKHQKNCQFGLENSDYAFFPHIANLEVSMIIFIQTVLIQPPFNVLHQK